MSELGAITIRSTTGNQFQFSVNAQTVQTQNMVAVTLSGNTSGAQALISSGTMTLAGGNNITVSQNGNAVTISGPNVGGAQTASAGIANSPDHVQPAARSRSLELGAITISVDREPVPAVASNATGQSQHDLRARRFPARQRSSAWISNGSLRISASQSVAGDASRRAGQSRHTRGTVSGERRDHHHHDGQPVQFSARSDGQPERDRQPATPGYLTGRGWSSSAPTTSRSAKPRLRLVGRSRSLARRPPPRRTRRAVLRRRQHQLVLVRDVRRADALDPRRWDHLRRRDELGLADLRLPVRPAQKRRRSSAGLAGVEHDATLSGTITITGVGAASPSRSNTGQRIDISVARVGSRR